MASPEQLEWLRQAYQAAVAANHKWPGCAAAEAAAEAGWGAHTPPRSNNVLGIKAYKGWSGRVVSANGTEQNQDGSWTGPQSDLWCVFPSMADCFRQQMMILNEPRYAAAMMATDPVAYIIAECQVWSTGQAKGQIVISIWHAHNDILNP